MTRKGLIKSILLAVILLAVGYGVGWLDSYGKSEAMIHRTVAVSWGDGKYGKAFYGAHVYLVPASDGYSVRARVYIGRGNDYFDYYHDCGEIGRVQTPEQAVEKWGVLTWTDKGLDIGDPSAGGYHLPRSKMESHR